MAPISTGGEAHVALNDDGIPKGSPSFVLEARVYRSGVEHTIHIYDDVVEVSAASAGHATRAVGKGSRTPATRHALERTLEAYKKRFGRAPDALDGYLSEKNKMNFQREFVRARDEQGLPEEEAKMAAVRRISFGRHRMALGYDDFEVKLGDMESINVGPPYGTRRVPKTVSVVARKFAMTQ